MASKKRARGDDQFKQEDVLQAVVIADSFNVRFAPITDNKPKVRGHAMCELWCMILSAECSAVPVAASLVAVAVLLLV